jgi:hypothetical protein
VRAALDAFKEVFIVFIELFHSERQLKHPLRVFQLFFYWFSRFLRWFWQARRTDIPASGGGTGIRNDTCTTEVKCYLSATMPALVIKSFPEDLHAKLRQIAASHRRSVTQETIHLLEKAISTEGETPPTSGGSGASYWANRKLLPEYEALLNSGALNSNVDSTIGLSEERDAR